MNVCELLPQEIGGHGALRQVAIFPHLVALLIGPSGHRSQVIKGYLIVLNLIQPDDQLGRTGLKCARSVSGRAILRTLNDHMDMVRHHDKGIEIDAIHQADGVQGVYNEAFEKVSLEDVNTVGGLRNESQQEVSETVNIEVCDYEGPSLADEGVDQRREQEDHNGSP